MKLKAILGTLTIIISLLLSSGLVLATPGANILYQETDMGGGWWQYDYTFENTSTVEYLYSVRLDFDSFNEVADPVLQAGWGGFWAALSPTMFVETHTSDSSDNIMYGDSLSGFSFQVNDQIGSVSFSAYVDDYEGIRTQVTGMTTVAPEPISSVLFLIGGSTLAARRWFGKKRMTA